jgi:hypothetical protein
LASSPPRFPLLYGVHYSCWELLGALFWWQSLKSLVTTEPQAVASPGDAMYGVLFAILGLLLGTPAKRGE